MSLMKLFNVITLVFLVQCVSAIYYDTYTGEVMSEEVYLQHVADNTTFWCVLEIDECDPEEWRRIGGACNNLNDPARGDTHTPYYRVLPRVFHNVTEPRLSVSGAELPNARKLRTEILATGTVPDAKFTNLIMHFLLFAVDETNSIHDAFNYVLNYDCCDEDRDNWWCIETTIPEDDPVFKFTDQTCINNTRHFSYQNQGCTVADTTDTIRINSEPPLYDLSSVYGGPDHLNITRLGTGGLIPHDVLDGYDWPTQATANFCKFNNATLNETRCHNSVSQIGSNAFVGLNIGLIWHLRNHNRIARALAEVNPCWDDTQLYYNAREINIASYLQILFYGVFAELLGRDNLIADGVLSESESFRDTYDDSLMPTESEEYFYAQRWYHTMVEGNLKLYDRQGEEVGSVKINELTLRTGWHAVDDHLAQFTQGAFRQPTASSTDQIIDPDFGNDVLRFLQAHSDSETNGLVKGRYFGIAPYIDYISYFNNGVTISTFEDLEPYVNTQMINILQRNYEDVRDIDLMAGLWAERTIPGGYVPQTLYWLSAEYMKHTIAADRHWYERPNRPHAFTEAQLAEIRKSTVSEFLCQVGEGVTEIQPNAFQVISETNPLTSCEEISAVSSIDFNAWQDDTCSGNQRNKFQRSSPNIFNLINSWLKKILPK